MGQYVLNGTMLMKHKRDFVFRCTHGDWEGEMMVSSNGTMYLQTEVNTIPVNLWVATSHKDINEYLAEKKLDSSGLT